MFRYHLSLHLFAENEVLLKAQGAEKNNLCKEKSLQKVVSANMKIARHLGHSIFNGKSTYYMSIQNKTNGHITKAEVFYNVKKRSTVITSKNLSKNLSNEKKHWCFW